MPSHRPERTRAAACCFSWRYEPGPPQSAPRPGEDGLGASVLPLPAALWCDPLHDRVWHVPGLVSWQVRRAGHAGQVLICSLLSQPCFRFSLRKQPAPRAPPPTPVKNYLQPTSQTQVLSSLLADQGLADIGFWCLPFFSFPIYVSSLPPFDFI